MINSSLKTPPYIKNNHLKGYISEDPQVIKNNKSSSFQNLGSDLDIDWKKLTEEKDNEFYEKYSFANEEIEFIQSMIKPMDK